MPTIRYDGHSFMIDGRRIWLVAGAIHYSRTPRQQWRARIRAARQAGINCIETYVMWNIHEPQPGKFDFSGDKDLRRFIEIIAEEGLYCILRPGPYICAEWDFGGFPPWLLENDAVRLRVANGPYLEACSRYITAVMEQVRDLQITGTHAGAAGVEGDKGGPIILMQAENEWFASDAEQEQKYLREIVHYLLEAGCTVPINECNNLWQQVEGTFTTWNGRSHLAANLRQLHQVQPQAPRFVTELWTGWFDHWNYAHDGKISADDLAKLMVETLATGSQYNLYMFHGGTNFGFYGGRTVGSRATFMTTSYDYDAPLLEAGGRGDKYHAAKRVSMFASQFGNILAHLAADNHAAALAPNDDLAGVSVIQQTGTMGNAVFIFRGINDKTAQIDLLLPNGLTLPVPLGKDRASWLLLDANLGGVATLNFTNLRPWAFVDNQMLVLFGPAGSEGIVAINDAQVSVQVPTGKVPAIETMEAITIVVLNEEQVDATYICPEGGREGIAVGMAGLDDNDNLLPLKGWTKPTIVASDGQVKTLSMSKERKPVASKLENWGKVDLNAMISGVSDDYHAIDGPTSFEKLRNDFGYGWYRVNLKQALSDGAKILAPQMGDRLHVYNDGKLVEILGVGASATEQPTPLAIGKDIVILADNLGRFNFGWDVGESKGLFGDIYEVTTSKLAKPAITPSQTPEYHLLDRYFAGTRREESNPADTLTWEFKPNNRQAMILDLDNLPTRALIVVNDELLEAYGGPGSHHYYVLKVGEQITSGKNTLAIHLNEKYDARKFNLGKQVKLYNASPNVTAKADWAFAKWQVPSAEQFKPVAPKEAGKAPLPTWYRCEFNITRNDVPLWLEPKAMTKGQLYLNGHNLGRYWVNTREGKKVPPQSKYYLPEAWLNIDEPNELIIFDEHGATPAKCKLVYDAMGPYNK